MPPNREATSPRASQVSTVMTYALVSPVDVPPYQIQHLISRVVDEGYGLTGSAEAVSQAVRITCAQALGSEIYVGCSNGQLARFALQAPTDDSSQLESYSVLSRQTIPNEKSVDEIVLVPGLSRAFILSDRIIYFYTIPSLDPVSPSIVKPIRHAVAFAVDHHHLTRPPAPAGASIEQVDFCVFKQASVALYTMRERLAYQKEIPLPSGALLAKRLGRFICLADKEHYNIIDLEAASLFPIIPISQASEGSDAVKPSITVVGDNEFLILSWTGATTIGLFITSEGDPVRGTLEWPSHPDAVSFDYPYITTLLSNDTIEIHSIETQSIVQVISAPPISDDDADQVRQRLSLVSSLNGYFVPSAQQSDKLRATRVPLLRGSRDG